MWIVICSEQGKWLPSKFVTATLRWEHNLLHEDLSFAIVQSSHLNHVAEDYFTSVMAWIPCLFVCFPCAKSLWHERGVLMLMHHTNLRKGEETIGTCFARSSRSTFPAAKKGESTLNRRLVASKVANFATLPSITFGPSSFSTSIVPLNKPQITS